LGGKLLPFDSMARGGVTATLGSQLLGRFGDGFGACGRQLRCVAIA